MVNIAAIVACQMAVNVTTQNMIRAQREQEEEEKKQKEKEIERNSKNN